MYSDDESLGGTVSTWLGVGEVLAFKNCFLEDCNALEGTCRLNGLLGPCLDTRSARTAAVGSASTSGLHCTASHTDAQLAWCGER